MKPSLISSHNLSYSEILEASHEKSAAMKQCSSLPHLMVMLIQTPLGDLMAIGDDEALYFLGFTDQRHLSREVSKIIRKTKRPLKEGNARTLISIRSELEAYFQGSLQEFKTPLMFLGTAFQNAVWTELKRTPYSGTRSYLDESISIGRPKSYRAVANANGANPFVIVIPCHRIIAADGTLGGYGGGLHRKEWLLAHEGIKKRTHSYADGIEFPTVIP